jgi:putative addiction module CopG family antidote
MKPERLTVDLTAELKHYVKDQVRSGRYPGESEVVRDAIRQMQQAKIEQFERIFGEYSSARQAEPTTQDDAAINAAVKHYRDTNRRGVSPTY